MLALAGVIQMWLGPQMSLPTARGEYLFLLALHTALHCPRGSAVPAFFAAGLARDVFIGSRLGAGALLYTLAGMLLALLRGQVEGNHIYMRLFFCFAVLTVLLCALPLLEGATADWALLLAALRDALYTSLLGPVARFVLEVLPLHSWRGERTN